MTNTNPATPAQAAAPGSVPAVVPPASASTPAPTGNQGKSGEGTVTIGLKEFRDLQRAKARTLSFDRRASFTRGKTTQPANEGSPAGQEDARVAQAETARIQADQRALAAEVKAGITEILSKEEFKNLPESTKALIRSNPAMLSDADNVEEALLDIEDKCREYAGLEPAPSSVVQAPASQEPPGHETPAAPGTPPAPTVAVELEDVSKLPPQERSRAVLRNAIKKSKGIK